MWWILLVPAVLLVLLAAVGYAFFRYAMRRKNTYTEDEDKDVVSIISYDGLCLYAKQVVRNPDKWVILLHGYKGCREDVEEKYAAPYVQQAYSLLIPDLRAHGHSEGKYTGMGWLDRLDLQSWIQFLVVTYPAAQIVLHGHSMGAATVLMASGEQLPQNIYAIVADCAYTSVADIFTRVLKTWFKLPPFPIRYISSLFCRIFCGFFYEAASAVEQVKKSKTPTLFFHGKADDFVPYVMGQALYAAAGCEKKMVSYEDAGHCESALQDTYAREVFTFLVRLRPFTYDDVLYIKINWVTTRLPGYKLPFADEELRKVLDEWNSGEYKGDVCLIYAIGMPGEIAGVASLIFHGKTASMGISISSEFQHQGIGTETVRQLMKIAREKGAERLKSRVRANNVESVGLHQKCGFTMTEDGEICSWEYDLKK